MARSVTSVTLPEVITIDGSIHPRKNCRKIGENYYLKGDVNIFNSGQCYVIDGTYYTISRSNSKIEWDYALQRYNFKTSMVQGIVNSDLKIGYFTLDYHNFVEIMDNNDIRIVGMNKSVVPSNYQYDFSNGCWRSTTNVKFRTPHHLSYKPQRRFLNNTLYGFGEDPFFEKLVDLFHEESDISAKSSVFDKYLPYKYGLEIETEGGYLPENVYFRTGAFPLKDGSINGEEVTTIPYTGCVVNPIKTLTKNLSEYTYAYFNNSVHINIGNIPSNPETRVALWILYCRLQPEIEAFIPPYKRDQVYMVEKKNANKDHCKYVPHLGLLKRYSIDPEIRKHEILLADKSIRMFLNEGDASEKFIKETAPKWEQFTRYYALNMLPMYFSRSEMTTRIEFRVHSGTVNPIKILNWLFITNAIVKYALEMSNTIFDGRTKILLEDVIEYVYAYSDNSSDSKWLSNYIKSYIRQRVQDHIKTTQSRSVYGDEFSNDKIYEFVMDGKSILNYEK